MQGFAVSTTSRFEGEWLFTAHVQPPLYPGVSIRFRGRSYQIADDWTLKVKFPAKDSRSAHAISGMLGNLIGMKCASLQSKLMEQAVENSAALFDALIATVTALERACEAGFQEEHQLQLGAKALLLLGDKSRTPIIAKSQARVQQRLSSMATRKAVAASSAG